MKTNLIISALVMTVSSQVFARDPLPQPTEPLNVRLACQVVEASGIKAANIFIGPQEDRRLVDVFLLKANGKVAGHEVMAEVPVTYLVDGTKKYKTASLKLVVAGRRTWVTLRGKGSDGRAIAVTGAKCQTQQLSE